ncbi:hypothetical protein Ae168Ps1_1335 [Pseudonocardia sp. Ae168_Ps1]|uniref:hypothetical protein n=1 Tax=unclassified Pseudonocardia TaxID=2619320 RepID=UPI0001FFE891|nr:MULTISPECIES: hypothetical protein [unclassified Pseudonocardia]ALE72946.1 hypothetical protein FRP1_07230 [Pseudonocardia sp. EC080625-04]ALL76271.1 hypothetical protein AD006_14845 [Pseudonocardia sp. EC080610-09]ALL83298.1 hypothetical protein AD017_22670 [Pseudonocardia sp. EC080619-01]OLL72953.1 hypothetical protein Ae150APs1_1331 [Pseudonocardia sp. Ae150A_Ps1]OLL78929.1 hypothetical protein Ae168Ps1_1335 [Pseudonocardia sp. Ae168_Ps1]
MIVDCDRCEVRGTACGDCVIGVLMDVPEIDRPIPYLPVDLPGEQTGRSGAAAVPGGLRPVAGGPGSGPVEFAEPERRALQVLADHGLIPHLQLVEPSERRAPAAERPLMPVPVVPVRDRRHRDAG